MLSVETSPFVFEGPVPPDDLAGREEELAALRDRATHGRFCLLYAPRRYGKTSCIGRLAADAERDREVVVVPVDLQGVLTLDDISRRIAAAYRGLGRSPVRDAALRILTASADAMMRTAGRKVGLDLGGGLIRPHEHPPAAALEALLDVPWEAAGRTGTRLLVVLDEFQAIADVERADAVLRSKIQHQRDRVSYLFSGSEQSVLAALFAERAAPLYGQAERFELGPLPDDVATDYVSGRFTETDKDPGPALSPLVGAAEGHPQRLNLLAHYLWGQVRTGGEATTDDWLAALDAALRHARSEFDAIWSSLGASQRKALRLASWGEPFSGAAARRLGLAGGAATSAREGLVRIGIIGRAGTVIDPLLAAWMRRSYPSV
ncbi:MAG: ATP-binding protein [Actinomycetota bacterium]|nr:ATP-binding protein [Actinomycetota bacterium]